ncbi:hypothetical protein [Pseudofrankia inefficax]|uniref:Helix-turn-helix domain-containing protein n=1 Tax=Pseudofrankia inefficax (strain DSM 45817 / CECT 9037 / DDB 130130 / EuI1c) TaxID=298654 RepID=E3J753_PSEI1|nr:hypothetical protein [Pseudofrankia inefficax]ADP84417.1 hypothetical protein FraEuI1c_6436 [Pseudofrankia inefficax]
MTPPGLTGPQGIAALGPTTDVPHTAQITGFAESSIYDAIRTGTWTLTRVLKVGRRIRIPTHDLIALLYPTSPSSEEGAGERAAG